MLTLNRPQFAAKETYLRCVSQVKDGGLRKRLKAVAQRIDNAAAEYATAATAGELHLVPRSHDVAGVVSKKEMIAIYERRMSRPGSAGRHVYDALIGLPDGGTCPFCAHGTVSTLDHMLPKSQFCELAVTPDNLVGACRDCNHAKSSIAPNSPGEAPVHPYFDDVAGENWLGARVIEGVVAALRFDVVAVDAWGDELNERIRRQFDALNLGRLYAAQAATQISGQRRNLTRIFHECGPKAVRHELRHQQHSWDKLGLNRWQAVTFRALARSKWYCAGGFRV